MLNTDEPSFTREQYLECGWLGGLSESVHESYGGIMVSLLDAASEQECLGKNQHSAMLKLLANAVSMRLDASSISEPFKPDYHGAARVDDFSDNDCVFFSLILDDIKDVKLKARLSDLIWVRKHKKSIAHANLAIDLYILHDINEDTWHIEVCEFIERAIRLCKKISNKDKLEIINKKVFSAFLVDYPDSLFMKLDLAVLLDELNFDQEFRCKIATIVYDHAINLEQSNDFCAARSYFDFASNKYKQLKKEPEHLRCLLAIAESFVKEATSRLGSSSMIANSFYHEALQAYRNIPVKHREKYGVSKSINMIHSKIAETGKATLNEMITIKLPSTDVSEYRELAIKHVSGKKDLRTALSYFSGFLGPSFERLKISSEDIIRSFPLNSLFSIRHIDNDGRTVAKSPISENISQPSFELIYAKMQEQFNFEINIFVSAIIIPALDNILIEHKVELKDIEVLCSSSSIIPFGRNKLTSSALFFGFKKDFVNAIHLICPQFEHIIRTKIKASNEITIHIDDEIETENGLGSLINNAQAVTIFGEDLVFEIKAIFTDPLGANLRNKVAHGLLDDQTANSIASVYAWWMLLRMIVKS